MSWGSRDIPVTLPSSAPRKAARLTIQATSQPLPGMRARPDLGDGLLHRVNFGPVDHNEVFSTTATRVICCRQGRGSRSRDGMAQRFVPLVDGVAPQNRTADPVYRLGRGSDPGDNRVCGTVPMSPSCAGLQELRLLAWRQDGGLGSSPPQRSAVLSLRLHLVPAALGNGARADAHTVGMFSRNWSSSDWPFARDVTASVRNDLRRCSGSKSSLEYAREHRIPSPASSTPRSSLRALVPASRLLVRLNHILADLEATGIVAQLCIRAKLRRRKDGQPSSQAAPSVPRTHARTEARHTSFRRAPREAKPTENYSMGAQNE